MAQFSKISKYAQADLRRVVEFLVSTQQNVGKLPDAMRTDSPIIEAHILNVLRDGDYSEADTYTRRLVGQLMAYVDDLKAGQVDNYARDRQVAAVAAANRKTGRVSLQSRVSLPEGMREWWEGLSPEDRGDFIAAAFSARWREDPEDE